MSGGLAQLVERLLCKQDVSGSSVGLIRFDQVFSVGLELEKTLDS